MIKLVFLPFLFVSLLTFAQEESLMLRIYDETEEDCGYINSSGDTILPIGECLACFTDSLPYAIVIKQNYRSEGIPAFDANGKKVFDVFVYDNGPDYIEEGTFRIIENGLIGYTTEEGEIIIPPTYKAALPFENGRAQVSLNANKEQDGEHWFWTNTEWFYIDKNGNPHENQKEEY